MLFWTVMDIRFVYMSFFRRVKIFALEMEIQSSIRRSIRTNQEGSKRINGRIFI